MVSQWTGISIKTNGEKEKPTSRSSWKELHQRVIGQEEAVSAVARSISPCSVGLKIQNVQSVHSYSLAPTGLVRQSLAKTLKSKSMVWWPRRTRSYRYVWVHGETRGYAFSGFTQDTLDSMKGDN